MKEANQRNDKAAADVWQHRLHEYLDRLFAKDANAGAAYHGLQVLPFSLGVQRPSLIVLLMISLYSFIFVL